MEVGLLAVLESVLNCEEWKLWTTPSDHIVPEVKQLHIVRWEMELEELTILLTIW